MIQALILLLMLTGILGNNEMSSVISEMKHLDYPKAFNLAFGFYNSFGNKLRPMDLQAISNKARRLALMYHDAGIDRHEEAKRQFYSPHKDRINYIKAVAKNPTIQLSEIRDSIIKHVAHNDFWIIKEFVNNSNIDLSFDGNYLLKMARDQKKGAMIKLLLTDNRVKALENGAESNRDEEVSERAKLSIGDVSYNKNHQEKFLDIAHQPTPFDQEIDKNRAEDLILDDSDVADIELETMISDNDTSGSAERRNENYDEWVSINDADSQEDIKKKARFWNRLMRGRRLRHQ